MSEESKRGTIFIDEDKSEIFKELTSDTSIRKAPFETGKDLLIAAAFYGYKLNCRKELRKKRELFKWGTFQRTEDIPAIKALALTVVEDENVLLNQDELLTVIEEYANGGIKPLYDAVKQAGEPLLGTIQMMLNDE